MRSTYGTCLVSEQFLNYFGWNLRKYSQFLIDSPPLFRVELQHSPFNLFRRFAMENGNSKFVEKTLRIGNSKESILSNRELPRSISILADSG
jgi:hypothetical protein